MLNFISKIELSNILSFSYKELVELLQVSDISDSDEIILKFMSLRRVVNIRINQLKLSDHDGVLEYILYKYASKCKTIMNRNDKYAQWILNGLMKSTFDDKRYENFDKNSIKLNADITYGCMFYGIDLLFITDNITNELTNYRDTVKKYIIIYNKDFILDDKTKELYTVLETYPYGLTVLEKIFIKERNPFETPTENKPFIPNTTFTNNFSNGIVTPTAGANWGFTEGVSNPNKPFGTDTKERNPFETPTENKPFNPFETPTENKPFINNFSNGIVTPTSGANWGFTEGFSNPNKPHGTDTKEFGSWFTKKSF